MRILVALLCVLIAPSVFAGAKSEKWIVTSLSETSFLFEKRKLTVLVDVDFAADADADEKVAKFIRSGDYVKAMKLLRTPESLGLVDQRVTVSASRKQYGATSVGVVETIYKQDEMDAVLTEHWWVKSHLSFHVSVLSRGTFVQSTEQEEQIFEPFAQDLGLIEGKTALYDFLLPRAFAQELRGSNGERRAPVRNTPPSNGQTPIDCQRDAATLGVDAAKARRGAPALSPAFTSATCKAGVKRIWDETRKSVFDLGTEYANRTARLRRQFQCAGYPPPPKIEWGTSRETWGQMFSRWGRNIGTTFTNSQQAQMASNCEEAAANGAMAQMAGNAVVGTVRGLATLGQLTQQLQYELTIGQTIRAANLVRYGKLADNDPLVAMGTMISNQWSGFKCLNDSEQAAKICKVAGEVTIALGSLAVGGGLSAAARLARIASIVGRAVEAEQAAAKAALALKLARAEQDGAAVGRAAQALRAANAEREAAANAVRSAKLSLAERVRASSRILGRELSPAERAAVERAHAFGRVGANGKYSVPDLREKLRIMMQSGLSKEDAIKLIKTGVTGVDPAVTAAALAAAASEQSPGSSLADTTIPVRTSVGQPAARFAEDAARLERTYERELALLDRPTTVRADIALNDAAHKYGDVSRLIARSISPADIRNTEFIDSVGGKYVKMMRLASFSGSSTSNEAGSMLARVLRELPPEKRNDFLQSMNNKFNSANRAFRDSPEIGGSGRMGPSMNYVENSTYESVINGAMGFESSTSPEAVAFYRRIDNAMTQREAYAELMARPGMQGITLDEFKELRGNAAQAIAQVRNLTRAPLPATGPGSGLRPTVIRDLRLGR